MRSKIIEEALKNIPLEISLDVGLQCDDIENWDNGEYSGDIDETHGMIMRTIFRHLLDRLSIKEIRDLKIFKDELVGEMNGIPVFESNWVFVPMTSVERRCWERERGVLIKTISVERYED